MKRNNKVIALTTLLFSALALTLLPNKPNSNIEVHADGEWTTISTKAIASDDFFLYDGSGSYFYFALSPNDYGEMEADEYTYVGSTPYYNTSDYNFLSYIQYSDDNKTYHPFGDLCHSNNANYFFKNGKFRINLRHNASTAEEDGTHEYIRVLEGCELPSYDYCKNGGTKKKYVQQETVIAKLNKYNKYTAGGIATYTEFVPKKKATFREVYPLWNNISSDNTPGYNHLILAFGEHGVDYLASNHNAEATNRAKSTFDIGNKLTINGLPIYKINEKFPSTKVGYDHGFEYFYVCYPVEVLQLNPNNTVPTLHIEDEAEFMDVLLPEITLKLIGGLWYYTNEDDVVLNDALDIDEYLFPTIVFPHYFLVNEPHPLLINLPANGAKLNFNITVGDLSETTAADIVNFDGQYGTRLSVFPKTGNVALYNTANNELLQVFYGFKFVDNTTYSFQLDITATANKLSVKFAINHAKVIDCEISEDRAAVTSMWVVDTAGVFTMDYFQEVNVYKPSIVYGGSVSYDFIEGDPIYNFNNVVDANDLYDDSVGVANITYVYEEGAVTNGRYNAGNWKLSIVLTVDGYDPIIKEIAINVHGTTSAARIFYHYSEVDDPLEERAIVGFKLVPPRNPDTYRKDGFDYVFDGWYFEGAKWDFENDLVKGDMDLYPRFVKMDVTHYIVTVKFEGIEKADTTYSLSPNSYLPFDVFDMDGATFKVYLGDNEISSLKVENDITITVKYTVHYTYVEPKEATCTENGNVGYWYSPVYANYYFADSEGRELIPNAIIPKLNHDIVHLDAKDSSCHEVGNVDCYYCNNCHKHFTDAEGEHELENWSIAKKPHVLTHHPRVEATCLENGNVEYWTCANEPGTYYGDEECTIILENVAIVAIGHDYRAPTYRWTETPNGYECTASITCVHCNDEITETKVATKVVVRASTCSEEGKTSFSVRFDDPRFNAQTKMVTTEKAPHNYVKVDGISPTKTSDGVKEHYECSECHKCFVKKGDTYKEVQYTELVYKYVSAGCGGNIATTSLISFILAGSFALLVLLKRKEEK